MTNIEGYAARTMVGREIFFIQIIQKGLRDGFPVDFLHSSVIAG